MLKTNLSNNQTVHTCRNAANRRHDTSTSVDLLIRNLNDELASIKSAQDESNRPNQRVRMVIPTNTPPRRALRGYEEPERVDWCPQTTSGFTPCRGRSVNDLHRSREAKCDGTTLLYVVADPNKAKSDVREPCRLCKTKTNFYCTGCKNYLCFGSQGINAARAAKIAATLTAETGRQPDAPKHFIKLPYMKEASVNYIFAHIMHKSALDNKWSNEP
jgi:hypothetical protein